MQELEDRIRHDGIVKAGNVLKVDAFLNHQCDVELIDICRFYTTESVKMES